MVSCGFTSSMHSFSLHCCIISASVHHTFCLHTPFPSSHPMLSSNVFTSTVEPLYRGHPWDPAGCPVYSGSVPNSNVDLYTRLLYVVGTANSVLSREVSQWCPLWRGSTVYRTASWVPMVPSIERFHCIQDSQLGPNGVHYREVPLYTGQPAGSQWCPL